LVEIKVLVEVDSDDEVERLTTAFEQVICPFPMDEHPPRCRYRWFIISGDVDVEEAAGWEELLNE
jgi:hypothetical protein